ncbi:DUF445 domain-containing protein [Aneurinibacillus tyrosinisolvens]|uniref:DUF445 domain-containing protein n=1 Tax=Aneurinibacillus tyrosinisolvens TaxID=1443435 RepID=UPI00063EFAF5|nr:DUF445 domain-containing protein [Aneurinibacillus tyrosinisolvens]
MSGQAKHIAGISLGVMGAGFAATLPFQGHTVLHILQGGFEAGLVGGLADWFAVTALFRHPMGIPIPHTALLPKNRDKITGALINTLENDWLTKESITEKIRSVRLTEKIVHVFERELYSDTVKTGLSVLSRHIIGNIDLSAYLPLFEKKIKDYLHGIDVQRILHRLIDKITEAGYEEKALDLLLARAGEWAIRSETRKKLGGIALHALENIELDGFMQFALKSFSGMLNEEKLGGIIQTLIVRGMDDLRRPENKNRQALLAYVREEMENLKHNPKALASINEWKQNTIENLDIKDRLSDTLLDFQVKALSFVQEKSFTEQYVLPLLARLLERIKENETMMESFENWLQEQIAGLVEANHSKIGALVKENLDKLDNETLIEMMEGKIGGDLQWIRVNGAICGFLIGLILTGIQTLAR